MKRLLCLLLGHRNKRWYEHTPRESYVIETCQRCGRERCVGVE